MEPSEPGVAPVSRETNADAHPEELTEASPPRSRSGTVLLIVALVIALATHAYNVFRYPLYLTDEGIYTEQAWSVLREGRLSPYTYFYDHAPMAWIVVAGWVGILPDQFNTFGNAINTGRVLMVIVHVASVFMLFEVVRRFSALLASRASNSAGSVPAAFLAAFVFSVSPLAVYYQRQVLLDNLMVFWVLVGLYILARRDGRVVTAMGGGMSFGMAMVTKENALFLLPGFAYLMHRSITSQHNRRFSASFWWFAALVPVGAYLLYAQTKNELLPAKLDFNLNTPPVSHVSLLYTVWWQLHRTAQGSQGSAFSELLRGSWLPKDKYLLIFGGLATLAALFVSLKALAKPDSAGSIECDRRGEAPLLGAALLAIGYGFYLTRSVLLDFYVLPLIPLLALNLGLLYARLTRDARPALVSSMTGALVILPLIIPGGYLLKYDVGHRLQPADPYRVSLTDLQGREVAWIRANVPPDSRMIIDDDLWVALHDNKPAYHNAHSHWKASADSDVRDKIFHADWHNLDYVAMSNQMRPAMEQNNVGGQENWILQAIDQHGQRVWQTGRGNVELEIIKINPG